jgi:hypothetical protein
MLSAGGSMVSSLNFFPVFLLSFCFPSSNACTAETAQYSTDDFRIPGVTVANNRGYRCKESHNTIYL